MRASSVVVFLSFPLHSRALAHAPPQGRHRTRRRSCVCLCVCEIEIERVSERRRREIRGGRGGGGAAATSSSQRAPSTALTRPAPPGQAEEGVGIQHAPGIAAVVLVVRHWVLRLSLFFSRRRRPEIKKNARVHLSPLSPSLPLPPPSPSLSLSLRPFCRAAPPQRRPLLPAAAPITHTPPIQCPPNSTPSARRPWLPCPPASRPRSAGWPWPSLPSPRASPTRRLGTRPWLPAERYEMKNGPSTHAAG
jgi:hypothetical protein